MSGRTFIIAEAGVNHNGSLDMALKLVEIAAQAGADAVKFQTFKANSLVSKQAPKADYQLKTTSANESQFEMLRKLELTDVMHEAIIEHCKKCNIAFMSTPFDVESLHYLVSKHDIPYIKIPSGEITNAQLLLHAARTGKRIILSTGMSSLGDVEAALAVLSFGLIYSNDDGVKPSMDHFYQAYQTDQGQQLLRERVILLHCTTEYPAPFHDVNLRAMDTLSQAFQLPVGLSDHTEGVAVSIAATARGAAVIEKHFTLDKALPGPDHKASLNPDELQLLIRSIRQVEAALGSPVKKSVESELRNVHIARKSLVALTDIKEGEPFTVRNLGVKRPGTGISPLYYYDYLGKLADRDYKSDEVIGLEDRLLR